MSITLGLPDNLPNGFNLFRTRIPGIDIAELFSWVSPLWIMKEGNKLKTALEIT
jgi:hypothetical protein